MPWDEEEVRRLVESIQARERVEESFANLFKIFYRSVHRFFLNQHFSSTECEDLTQIVFLRVYEGVEGFGQRAKFATWLFEIAVNVYRNEIRRRGATKRKGMELSLDGGTEDDLRHLNEKISLRSPAPESALDELLEKERLDQLRAAIREMPPQMRRCVYLRHLRGFKYREIALLMKISIQTVRAHLHQARERLKLELNDEDEE